MTKQFEKNLSFLEELENIHSGQERARHPAGFKGTAVYGKIKNKISTVRVKEELFWERRITAPILAILPRPF